jgi:4-diphosphocytidyl-2-C-methyl-D-erythritol kinase
VSVHLLAPAKLNLGLEVIRRRDDGYHEIATVMAAIAIFDRISVTPSDAFSFSTNDPRVASGDNLAIRAAQLLLTGATPTSVHLHLQKRIPIASGLGGASSDAAATLIAINKCCGLGVARARLVELGAKLGSDVPFFFAGPAALVEGRGDRATPIAPIGDAFAIVVAPRLQIPAKTGTLYRLLQVEDFSDGSRVHPSARIGSTDDLYLGNAFTRPLYAIEPSLRELPTIMRDCGAREIALAGAGPAHFALEHEPERAYSLARRLRSRLGLRAQVFVAKFLRHGPLIAKGDTTPGDGLWLE